MHLTETDEPDVAAEDILRLVAGTAVLGGPSTWRRPPGYPDSLALCLLDSIWSLGANYDHHVVPVLNRYREFRGGHADRDTATDLVGAAEACGGPAAFAQVLRNRQLTSTRKGVLKAQAVMEAARMLSRAGIETPAALQANADEVAAHWRQIPGQRSSATGWRYLLLLAGASEAKPDRMIVRFVSGAVGRPVAPEEAHTLLQAAAPRLGVPLPSLDHRIWLYQSGRLLQRPEATG